MTKKKKEENIDINININDLKKEQCPECKGDGKVNNLKCPTCGGSGSTEIISNLSTFLDVKKGTPQRDYEVIVKDTATGKTVYKKKSFGGAMVSVDSLDKFTGELTEGNYQSALWGNPLICRFGIDRLEETFAKNIDNYVEALHDTGTISSDKEELKNILIEGFDLQLKKRMGSKKVNAFSKKEFDASSKTKDAKESTDKYIKVVKDTMKSGLPFVSYLHRQDNSKDAKIDCVLHKIPLKRLLQSALEFTATTSLKQTNTPYTDLAAKGVMLKVLKDLADDIFKH